MTNRDESSRQPLPPLESPYNFDLSKAEINAFEDALADGFGLRSISMALLPLTDGIDGGLLKHHKFFKSSYTKDFWNDYFIAPAETFPLGFNIGQLEKYFKNQLDRFSQTVSSAKMDRSKLEELTRRRFYEKPWYELHALDLISSLKTFRKGIWSTSEQHRDEYLDAIYEFVGKLGRLAEQYYWKFCFEPAAKGGVRSKEGARKSGMSRATRYKAIHAVWQNAATEIWSRRPGMKKADVARAVQKRLNLKQTSRNIERYISRRPLEEKK
jgi:hypothetical protein